MADAHVRIPMLGQKESLNVATAGGIVMYELLRKWRNSPHSKIANCAILEWGTLGTVPHSDRSTLGPFHHGTASSSDLFLLPKGCPVQASLERGF